MAQWPDGIAFQVFSKQAGQQKWIQEGEFVPDSASGYFEGDAQADAWASFQSTVGGHVGGTKEYHCRRCVQLGYEVRPV